MSSPQSINFSFELFPPKTSEGLHELKFVQQELNKLKPSYFSVTFGAGGSLQQKTLDVVQHLASNNICVKPHITCINMTSDRLHYLLGAYKQLQIKNMVVIQGDMPAGQPTTTDEFHYANELVNAIHKISGNAFDLTVAAYPEFHPRSKNPTSDLINFKRKLDSGATNAITQFFFNSDAYFRFLEFCAKHSIFNPIIPGIIPIADYHKLVRFSAACGAEIPLWLRKHLETYQDDIASLKQIGIEFVTRLCENLITNGVKNFHFYTLNQLEPSRTIIKNLGLC